jgi:hypothetical protein
MAGCVCCDDTHWVCENHSDRPDCLWLRRSRRALPVCNNAGPNELPILPKGFETSFTATEIMRPLLRKKPSRGPKT